MINSKLERIDNAQFNELRELLEEDFDDLIRTFFQDSQLRMDEVRLAYETRDNRLGYEAIHAMKGASVNLGANLLADLCYKLQMQCKDQQITDSVALIENIDQELKLLITELKSRLS